MSKLVEVEIENKLYIKLLDLEQQKRNTLRLTTLEDNQTAVSIKIFLNNSDNRILIKEFNIRNLKLKVSGVPRFELRSSFNNKILYMELMVDGKIVEETEIRLRSYLRNKQLPIFILVGLIVLILLFSGVRWFLNSFSVYNTSFQTTENKIATENIDKISPVPLITKKEPEKEKITPAVEEKTIIPQQIIKQKQEPEKEIIISMHTFYFPPNNTDIQKETALKLTDLAGKLKEIPKAQVKISGYCAMTGTDEGRERLSRERAYNVLAYLKNEGWTPETEPEVRWYGGLRPITLNEDEIYKNRRVEIEIVSQ